MRKEDFNSFNSFELLNTQTVFDNVGDIKLTAARPFASDTKQIIDRALSENKNADYNTMLLETLHDCGIKASDIIKNVNGNIYYSGNETQKKCLLSYVGRHIVDPNCPNDIKMNSIQSKNIKNQLAIKLNSTGTISISDVGAVIETYRQEWGQDIDDTSPMKKYFPERAIANVVDYFPIWENNYGVTQARQMESPFPTIDLLWNRMVSISPMRFGESFIIGEKLITTLRKLDSFSEQSVMQLITLGQRQLMSRLSRLMIELRYKALTNGVLWEQNNEDVLGTNYNLNPATQFTPLSGPWMYIDVATGFTTVNVQSNPVADLTYLFDGSFQSIRLFRQEMLQTGEMICNPLIQKCFTLNPNVNQEYRTFFANMKFDRTSDNMFLEKFVPNCGNMRFVEDATLAVDKDPYVIDPYTTFAKKIVNFNCPDGFIFFPFAPNAIHGNYAQMNLYPQYQTGSMYTLGAAGKYSFISEEKTGVMIDNPRIRVFAGVNAIAAIPNPQCVVTLNVAQYVNEQGMEMHLRKGGDARKREDYTVVGKSVARGWDASKNAAIKIN